MLPANFAIRPGTLDDAETVVAQRRAMFLEMGYRDEVAMDRMCTEFRPWLVRKMQAGEYLEWLAVGTDVPQRVYSLATAHEASDADTESARTGKIIVQTDLNHCRQGTFDNANGRIVGNDEPCSGDTVLDAHGIPVPTGTIRRLNSISKSFSGN